MSARTITSLTNPTVKAVRALHMRKERDATGHFLAEGLKFIGEALDQQRAPRLLLVGEDARPHPILDRARAATRAAGGEVVVVTHAILEKISRRDNPQTVLGVFDQVYTPLSAIQPATAPAWVALEQVRDPGNLGTIIRTAASLQVDFLVAGRQGVWPFSRRVLRTSMGSVLKIPVVQTDDVDTTALQFRAAGFELVATVLDEQAEDLAELVPHPRRVLLLGNEDAGLA
ncbi:MAG: TrmH family RNA methyltransferase, partial [Alphaproteobacteria bacterium]